MRCIWMRLKDNLNGGWLRLIVTWDVFEFPVARDTPKSVKWLIVTWDVFEYHKISL